ncbi:MAG: co-chaperone GroES [Bacteroidales bacterium]|jgi:chaperonin GroES|nr:co-chaperone GroES [Bacteroidales bacterium]
MKELQPLNEQVLLDISEENTEQKTASGIIIPDSAKEKKKTAKVIAISEIENSAIKVGDTVLYKEFAGTETQIDDKKYLLIAYADLLAKVVDTEKI